MKKFTSLFLVFVLILSLVGCSNAANKNESKETTTTSVTSSKTLTSETFDYNSFNNFISDCYSFIDTGKFSVAGGYPKEDHGSLYNYGGLDASWVDDTVDCLNSHIVSIPDYARPTFYSIEMLEHPKNAEGYFQITILKSSKDSSDYIKGRMKRWIKSWGPVYVYTFSQVNYDDLCEELNEAISLLSDKEKSNAKENLHLIFHECK